MNLHTRRRLVAAGALAALGGLALAGCATSSASGGGAAATQTLRLGYFPNLTHATAIVGVDKGIFARDLGSHVKLTTATFTAGPTEVQALLSGSLDAAFVGPSPIINAYAQSGGAALRVVAGATSGGAELVVRKSITSVAQLRGTTLATPQLGNTQDVALRYWLRQHGIATTTAGGGAVHIAPQTNSVAVAAFAAGSIAGGWVPEPYATKMVKEGGHVLVDERSLWPGGRFATTELVVRTSYLAAHPTVVSGLLKGLLDATDWVEANPAAAEQTVAGAITRLTGTPQKVSSIRAAWKHLSFTLDPLAATVRTDASHAEVVGLLKPVNLTGLFDLTELNKVLAAAGKPAVSS